MASRLFYTYYDRINADKDYRAEVRAAIAAYRAHSRQSLRKILDVGCGTGNHAFVLAEMGYEVLGVDINERMIALAKGKQEKAKALKVRFQAGPIEEVRDRGFQLALSLFNVVNYIDTTGGLLSFFRAVRRRLARGGIFIFDVWNGVAALREPPRLKKKKLRVGNAQMHCLIRPETKLFEQKTILRYVIKVYERLKEREFHHEIEHILWTPKCLSDLLEMSQMDVLKVVPFMLHDRDAGADDWKLTFVTVKR